MGRRVNTAAASSSHIGRFEAERLERAGIVRPLRCVEDLDADDAALGIVIDHDSVGDLLASLDGPVGQDESDRVRSVIHPHPHGLIHVIDCLMGHRFGFVLSGSCHKCIRDLVKWPLVGIQHNDIG